MSKTYRKDYWKDTRKEPALLNQKGGPMNDRRKRMLEEIEERELLEELDDDAD